ncbi:Ankyrin repeat and SOCS box protein 13 [Phytophthora citrophthora]|uniref:Ankyrin repeat and SOCS box protein 13 n=1 Tax=Phytophthora citrophthora TaxID=4793 RepID=A0AAD9GWF4_9STRA|nr:Ankyrin repeat and SOCS box protein 13 [Phytophthora citrophthora]
MATRAQEFAFVSWDGSNGRRACPLAAFGSRAPHSFSARLICADPPRADQSELRNATELHGAIALVVRGGCSFAHKARLLQRAGAVAMLLANNSREEPLATFTMGEEEQDEHEQNGTEEIAIPCVTMCLRDVRTLFQKFPPSVKTGVLSFEILPKEEAALVADACLRVQQELQEAAEAGKGWKAIKRTTTSLMKMLEPVPGSSPVDTKEIESTQAATVSGTIEKQTPLLAFVQWATSPSTYELCFAPLADFCSATTGASYTGKLVACDPLLADKPLLNAQQLTGAVALLRRGACSFPEKLERVQRAGAVAAVVCNDDEQDLDAAFVMSVDRIDAANATLPAVMISHKNFLQLQPALNGATARVLCLEAGETADGLLASSGKRVSFEDLPKPLPNGNPLVDLFVACRDGDHAACQRVLAGVDGTEAKRNLVTASCSADGLTALHHACAGGNSNVLELLLQLGAAPDAEDVAMQTPLHIACANSYVDCARLLLRAEASTNRVPAVLYNIDGGLPARRNIGGGTAMHDAARTGSSECVELLLSANARVDDADRAAGKYVFLGVSAKDLHGRTPLHLACEQVHAGCALYLVAANANVNSRDVTGRSPLGLVCEAANDPEKAADALQIIEKLIASGADMNESDPSGERLLLDRLESPELRRELEVLYLRYEAQSAKQSMKGLRQEIQQGNEQIQGLEEELSYVRSQVARHEAYERQIQQLQSQMQLILQFQTSYGSSSTVVEPLLAPSSEEATEQELALDAALARDLGKKCLRQSQNVLAEKYFQRSLELLPLPGVQRLLANVRQSQRSEGLLSPAVSPRTPQPKTAKLQQLEELVRTANAAPQARSILEKELDKLKSVSDEEEFALNCRWVEWLVALPWGDPSSGLQSEDLCTLRRAEFQHLEAIDDKRFQVRQGQAARIIQRTFRDRFALHLQTRSQGATRIQALVRGKLSRQRFKAMQQELLAAQDHRTNQQDESQLVLPSQVDYATTIDPSIERKLPLDYRVHELITGVFLPSRQSGTKVDEGKVRVLQLLQCVEAPSRGSSYTLKAGRRLSFFVWTRWGTDLDQKCPCALSGPYDDLQDARRRFDRIVSEENPPIPTACESTSSFEFLRNIVGAGSLSASA